jgi:ABC-type uncharacterized transport system substrate-binding protein
MDSAKRGGVGDALVENPVLSLKGANPADLPVERPPTFDLVLNLATAQALGLTIPPSVLQQATDIIQ